MNYEILKDDRLRIYLQEGDREELQQLADEYGESFNSDDVMYEVFEPLLCNSDLQWSSPDRISALTGAPVLCVLLHEEEPINDMDEVGYIMVGSWPDSQGMTRIWGEKIIQAWAFMDYAVRSPQEDLLKYGECFWDCAWKVETTTT